ncbi:MAG: exo-alpha-sialidase [Clostridia bacterium]|nr:exo-alpha-sialidase [Clostridia bacterium]
MSMLIREPSVLASFDTPHRIWQGIPGIARTRGGRTYLCFYSGGIKEDYGNFCLVQRSDDEKDYGKPILAAKKEGLFRCFDPVLWTDPRGRLWFFFNVMPGEEVYASVCEDPDAEEPVFSEERYVGRGIMMNKPTVLSDGSWLLSIAIWSHDLAPEFRAGTLTEEDVPLSYVYRSTDEGKSFVRIGGADVPERCFDEHMVLERKDGSLLMLVRTRYGIGKSVSRDGGRTWSLGEDSGLGGPCTRFHIRRLRSGRVLLLNHVNFTGRNNLTALLSEDDGETFPHALLFDERAAVTYPDADEDEAGNIYITYDRERGAFAASLAQVYECEREILVARVTERDILAGELVTEGSYLKRVVSKLGTLAPEHGDPFADVQAPTEEDAEQAALLGRKLVTGKKN